MALLAFFSFVYTFVRSFVRTKVHFFLNDCPHKQTNKYSRCTATLHSLIEPFDSFVVSFVHLCITFCLFASVSTHMLDSNFHFIYSEARYFYRRLLRFSVKIDNLGLADFRPNVPRSKWIWHKCHKHYHSMETFSSYDLISKCLRSHISS